MTSFISAFRGSLYALAAIVLTELLLLSHLPENYMPYSQSLFSYRYMRQEQGEQVVIAWKMMNYIGKPVEFVQAGDSTGYFGVNPTIVKYHLPGYEYLNTNCCASTSYRGYRYISEAFLKENPKARYTVLTLSYPGLPMRYASNNYPALWNSLTFPMDTIKWLPSLQYRGKVTNFIYYGRYGNYIPGLNFKPAALHYNLQDNGFRPVPDGDRKPVNRGECHFDYLYDAEGRATLAPELEKFKAVADKYNTKMVLIFNPVSCTPGLRMEPILDNIRLFLKKHPDVISPLPLVRQYPAAFFRDDEGHMEVEGAIRNSHEIGQALARALQIGDRNAGTQGSSHSGDRLP